VTEPPLCAVPAVVTVAGLLPPVPPFPLPLLEHAAAAIAKTTTIAMMVERWRARSDVATFPPAVQSRSWSGTVACTGVTGVTSECTGAT
jgi:hypothetical protein